MKSRPRSVERKVAAHISELSSQIGAGPVYRIPVLGRTGPDITSNELGLVIDVKSRLSVPVSYLSGCLAFHGDLAAFPLDSLLNLAALETSFHPGSISTVVERWYEHMDAWRKDCFPTGLTSLVLHRPKLPTGRSAVVIHRNHLEELSCRINKLRFTNPATTWPSLTA